MMPGAMRTNIDDSGMPLDFDELSRVPVSRWERRFMKSTVPILSVVLLCIGVGSCKHSGQDAQAINLFAWSEYVPQEVIDGFTRETGIKVNYEKYDSNEAMMTKLSQGSSHYDLIQPSEYAVENLIHRNMLERLDAAQIPNVKNLDPKYRDLPYDPGQKFSVPYMAGTVGIVVNTDKIKDPIRGYTDVFQEKYKKRIVCLDDNREIVSWALDVLKIPINDITPDNLDKAKPLIAQWLPLVRVFNSDDPKTPLTAGDCDLGIVYCGDAATLYDLDPKFKYVLPAEGAHQFIDNLCIPKGAEHKLAAEQFINYILRPEVSKLISDKFPYTNPNAEARKLLTQKQLSNPASYPQAEHLEVFHDIGGGTKLIGEVMGELRSKE
jgi:spermidine/putrescine transport system substrate-binding protein